MQKKTEAAAPVVREKAYILRLDDAPMTNGVIRVVRWVNGHGVLDRYALASVRPDYCDPQSLRILVGYDILAELARWWGEHGAAVKEVTEEEAARKRKELDHNPTGHLPKAKEAKETKETEAKKEAPAKARGKKPTEEPPHRRDR